MSDATDGFNYEQRPHTKEYDEGYEGTKWVDYAEEASKKESLKKEEEVIHGR